MINNFNRLVIGIIVFLIIMVGQIYAETFEFLSYTPPRGWTNQVSPDKSVYQRKSGVGLITFYSSYSTSGSAADEFAKIWRSRIEPTLPGAAPQPQIQSEGDYTLAVGARQVNTEGAITTLGIVTIVGKGRAIGVLTMATGDDVLREVTTFLDSIDINKSPAATSNQNSGTTGEIEVDFEVPPGYISKRDGQTIVLTPTKFDEKTPCAYVLGPSRASSGNLETDARAAILEPHPGWKLKHESYNAMRGTTGSGWKYFMFHTGIENFAGGNYQYVTAMAMALPAGPGRVNIVWGVGNAAHCTFDDLTFARLFHSLRPHGWNSDAGQALSKELPGLWRYTHSYGVMQYKFMANGRYEFGRGTTTTTGMLERTSSTVSDGSYKLSGNELVLTPDEGQREKSQLRVRVYEKYTAGRWWRMMSLINETANPALEVQYERIEN
jgi:hypothetical protein